MAVSKGGFLGRMSLKPCNCQAKCCIRDLWLFADRLGLRRKLRATATENRSTHHRARRAGMAHDADTPFVGACHVRLMCCGSVATAGQQRACRAAGRQLVLWTAAGIWAAVYSRVRGCDSRAPRRPSGQPGAANSTHPGATEEGHVRAQQPAALPALMALAAPSTRLSTPATADVLCPFGSLTSGHGFILRGAGALPRRVTSCLCPIASGVCEGLLRARSTGAEVCRLCTICSITGPRGRRDKVEAV